MVLTARRTGRLERVAAEINVAGGRAIPLQLDVTDADQLTKVVAEAERQFGPVTILVNNPGIPDAQRVTKIPMDLNVRALYVLSCQSRGD
ncbi:SDR family NAD(P)-dependent oxidoreductase [Bradyrhizobium lupini]|uniref:SDR family NAD(P)-dependent oxidoreductase n=1 Tax=Rhizobium lupini TaxID=136996 RepID=UPI0034C5FDB6